MRIRSRLVMLGLSVIAGCGRSPAMVFEDGAGPRPEWRGADGPPLRADLRPDSPRPRDSGVDGRHDLLPSTDKPPPPPPLPDLVIKQLDAKVSGTAIVYDAVVCNVGTAAALLFRVDFYYNRVLPPGPLQVGDSSAFILALGPGACQTHSRTYQSAPVGLYTSWAFVDTLGTVKEANEGNNVAGPKQLAISPPADCFGLCAFAISCGTVKLAEYAQCLTGCNLLAPAAKQCATAAQQTGSCAGLAACKLPPLPPAPPPPWECLPLCQFLINPCKLVPANQLVACGAACLTLPSTKLGCAVSAMSKQQCVQTLLCIF